MSWVSQVDPHETYVVLVNKSKKTIKKGDEVFYSYGRRTNGYLMMNYGFCYPENKYESVEISLEMRKIAREFNAKELVSFDF